MPENRKIIRVKKTRANLQASAPTGLNAKQIAIEEDNDENMSFKDDDLTYHLVADQKISGGSSGNNTFGDLTIDNTVITAGSTLKVTDFTAKSVLIAGTAGLVTQDNAGLSFDATTNRLSVNTANTVKILNLNGDIQFTNDSATKNTIDVEIITSGNGKGIDIIGGETSEPTSEAEAKGGSILIKGGEASNQGRSGGNVTIEGGEGVVSGGSIFIGSGASSGQIAINGQVLSVQTIAGVITNFNAALLDADFRVSGDGEVNLFYCDGGLDKVGIGRVPTTQTFEVGGDMSVFSTAGIDINPGSDVDADLITVGVTGAPKLSWDESADEFDLNKALNISAKLTVGGIAEFNSNVNVDTAAGIDVNPGSDIDSDLITVGVTGAPKMFWDESADSFSMTSGLILKETSAITRFKIEADASQESNITFIQDGSAKGQLFNNMSVAEFTLQSETGTDLIFKTDSGTERFQIDANGLIPNNGATIHAIAQTAAPTSTIVGALWLDTDRGTNGTLMCSDGTNFRVVAALGAT